MNDDVGGYERDHSRTFGVGTMRQCPHEAFAVLYPDGIWRGTSMAGKDFVAGGDRYEPCSVAQPGDVVGTKRCLGCGNELDLRDGKA